MTKLIPILLLTLIACGRETMTSYYENCYDFYTCGYDMENGKNKSCHCEQAPAEQSGLCYKQCDCPAGEVEVCATRYICEAYGEWWCQDEEEN